MDRRYGYILVLTAALTLGSGGLAIAQTTTDPAVGDATTADQADDGFDWGWLGLIGLAGLAGLARRKEPVRTTTAGTVR